MECGLEEKIALIWLDIIQCAYLNPCSNYDSHEEVGDNASNCHH